MTKAPGHLTVDMSHQEAAGPASGQRNMEQGIRPKARRAKAAASKVSNLLIEPDPPLNPTYTMAYELGRLPRYSRYTRYSPLLGAPEIEGCLQSPSIPQMNLHVFTQ